MKKETISKLEMLFSDFISRKVGNTYTVLNGVKNNPKAILIVADYVSGRALDLPRNQTVTVASLPESLYGKHLPIIIDHDALRILVREMRKHYKDKIIELEKKLGENQ